MKKPNLKPNDVHVIVNDWEDSRYVGEAKCYTASGEMLWKIPALCKGVNGPNFDITRGDTPPGLYLAGKLTETQSGEPWKYWAAYGKYFIDLEEQENQEHKHGRSEIGWHGGGTGLSDPLEPLQELIPTYGCIRSHNKDIEKIVVPTLERVRKSGGQMWITVNQLS